MRFCCTLCKYSKKSGDLSVIRHIVLLGAGAVGVLPGEKLRKLADVSLTVAADRERIARYRKDGIFFNGEKLPFSYASPDEMQELAPADLVLIATKTCSLEAALENIVPLVNDKTILLPLLNGITAADVVQKKFPQSRVLQGFFLGHASVRESNRISHDGVGTFYLGGETAALTEVKQLFDRAGIPAELPVDFQSAMWKKFVLNVGVNQTQAMFRANYGQMQNSPELLDFARRLMEEAVLIAQAEQISGTGEMVSAGMKVICSIPGDVMTSMLQDVLAGRTTEVDSFAGTICARAARYNIPVPFNTEVLRYFCAE